MRSLQPYACCQTCLPASICQQIDVQEIVCERGASSDRSARLDQAVGVVLRRLHTSPRSTMVVYVINDVVSMEVRSMPRALATAVVFTSYGRVQDREVLAPLLLRVPDVDIRFVVNSHHDSRATGVCGMREHGVAAERAFLLTLVPHALLCKTLNVATKPSHSTLFSD